jgi:hypothetical protein
VRQDFDLVFPGALVPWCLGGKGILWFFPFDSAFYILIFCNLHEVAISPPQVKPEPAVQA